MTERPRKAGFHLLLSGIALWEFIDSDKPFRKACSLAWAAFHGYLAFDDWKDKEERKS